MLEHHIDKSVDKKDLTHLNIYTVEILRPIPLNIRAMCAETNNQRTSHCTLTFWTPFETSHCS